jgi:hypothetical protein
MSNGRSPSSRAALLWLSLRECPPLAHNTPERDSLWLEVRSAICTQAAREITPFGSLAHVRVTEDHATEELIAAMTWLYQHEALARSLDAQQLLYALWSVAIRGSAGSARSTQADSLHGMTHVPAGCGILWQPIDGAGVT